MKMTQEPEMKYSFICGEDFSREETFLKLKWIFINLIV